MCLKGGRGPSKKWILLGGCVGGALLVVILISLFPWHKRSQSPKRVPTSKTIWKVFKLCIKKNHALLYLCMKKNQTDILLGR